MDKLAQYGSKQLQTGFAPDVSNDQVPLWRDTMNVYSTKQGLAPMPGAELLASFTEPISGLNQASVNGNARIYVGGRSKAWYWTPSFIEQIADSLVETNRTRIETFGTWAIINNGVEYWRLWKNSGRALPMLNTGFTHAKHCKRFFTFLLAANTSVDQAQLAWCSSDNVENWTAVPENTAGDLFIRDLDGPIMAVQKIGNNLAAYSNETLVLVTYLGNSFVIGAQATVRGIGVWGGESVCHISGYNFGFGPQGIFRTDGATFDLLDVDRVRGYTGDTLDESQRELAYAWFNEVTHLIEFCYLNLEGTWTKLQYDPKRDSFWPSNLQQQFAIERQVFAYPLAALGQDLLCLGKGTTWNSAAISGFAETKDDDFGVPSKAKTLERLRIDGEGLDNLTVKITATSEKGETPWTVLEELGATVHYPVADAEFYKTRLSFDSGDPFLVSDLEFSGFGTGNKG